MCLHPAKQTGVLSTLRVIHGLKMLPLTIQLHYSYAVFIIAYDQWQPS
jgi:hypothetical protein